MCTNRDIFVKRLNELYEEMADKEENYPYNRVKYANFLGVTHNQVAGWLDNRSEAKINYLCRIADRHNVSLDWLVGRSDVRNPYLTADKALSLRIQELNPQTYKALVELLNSIT